MRANNAKVNGFFYNSNIDYDTKFLQPLSYGGVYLSAQSILRIIRF